MLPNLVHKANRLCIVAAALLGTSACTERTWIETLDFEVCKTDDDREILCSCATATTAEIWPITKSAGECRLNAPAGAVCEESATANGWRLDCVYPNDAPACATLRFTKGAGGYNLVGMVVNDPVCTSSLVYPNTGTSLTARITIPSVGGYSTVTWDAWSSPTCEIDIVVSRDPP